MDQTRTLSLDVENIKDFISFILAKETTRN